jgi:AraC-like DNA-binding protein
MYAGAVQHGRIAPSPSTASAVAGLFVDERDHDEVGVAIPRPEIHIVARFGATQAGLDVHALGVRERVHRKLLRCGQRAVTARLQLGAPEGVLGVPGSALAGRSVALEDLWGDGPTQRLLDRLAGARDMIDAARILESAIAERLAVAHAPRAPGQLALNAAERLTRARVNAVASELGVSERHLRRVFREAVGVSPKTFAKLARFQRALGDERLGRHAGWASIAVEAGYYDQAHLIAEFRAIAGVTPQALIAELRVAPSVG